METGRIKAHFIDNYLLNPTNPITVNLIGAGGTGSHVLTALARIHHSLVTLGHAGLFVRVFDDDIVTEANRGRQLFTQAELGLKKAVALVNRINRFFSTGWKAITRKYNEKTMQRDLSQAMANLTISCVDNAATRFEIAAILKMCSAAGQPTVNQPLYWMDFGNSRYTGQVLLSTVKEIRQPASKKYAAVNNLPLITDEFSSLLSNADTTDDTPSCSLAEALTKQDLFINSTLADLGASLIWQMFTEGFITNRGFFLNLKEFRTQPVKV